MTNKSIIAITAVSALGLTFAFSFMHMGTDVNIRDADTMAMAPISLGNPAAAATLQTRRQLSPIDEPMPEALPAVYTQRLEVGNGDTLAELLVNAGVDRTDAYYAIQALAEHYNPRRIRLGQDVTLSFKSAPLAIDARTQPPQPDIFIGFAIEPDYKTEIRVARTSDGAFHAEPRPKTLKRTPVRAIGNIQDSLYVSGRDAGVPAVVIARLIRLLSWDVDFQRDIRTGDSFELMYERVTDAKGKPVYNGAVTFAALTLSGKRITVYRHELPDGTIDYFDENGKASRKALMRTPIDGARLSSTFGARKHPILGYTRMHKGVDFAAPSGTPIYAAGNGTVAYAGRKGGYGNYIRIRHNGNYETAYAHMKGFAKSVRSGSRVEQGQIIGYVGTTGRSTGPHLHYEVLKSGNQVNPLKVQMPTGRSLSGKELIAFKKERVARDKLFASLGQNPEIASTSNAD